MEFSIGHLGLWPVHLLLYVLSFPLSAIDQAEHRLPDRLVLPAWLASALWAGGVAITTETETELVRAFGLSAMVVLGAWLISELPGEPLGFGDVKLAGLLALHGGWYGEAVGIASVLAGCVIGGIAAMCGLLRRAGTWSEPIPLGPALLVGWWGVLTLHTVFTHAGAFTI